MHGDGGGEPSPTLPVAAGAWFGLVIAAGVMLVLVAGTASAGPVLDGMAGNGTVDDPYVITNVTELQAMEEDLDAHYVLGNDVDASGYGFEPVGDWEEKFVGRFDGQGHVVTGLSIETVGQDYVGVFGAIGDGGVVRDVGFEGIDVRARSAAISDTAGPTGGLAGWNGGTVTDTYVVGDVSGESNVGGLIGLNDGSVTDSYAAGGARGIVRVGGLVGTNDGSVRESYANSSVGGPSPTSSFPRILGGLVGWNLGTVDESFATGDVDGVSPVGGLIGKQESAGTLRRSYATGDVDGTGTVGGVVGENDGAVVESYAAGSVDASLTAGGLVAFGDGTVTDSYWDEQTTGQSSSDGGTGLATAQMTGGAATANMDGFDFATTWATTGAYPVLRWQLPHIEVDAELTPRHLVEGETARIAAEVANPTSTTRTVTATLAVDGTDVATEQVDVAVDATRVMTFDHAFTGSGEHAVSLTVTDGDTTETFEWTVSVNEPPVASFDRSLETPDSDQTMTLDASDSTDPDGTIASYEWDLDDDGQYDDATGVTTDTSFATSGERTVSVRVTDDDGATDTAQRTFRVNAPPTAALSAPGSAVEGTSVTLDASGSSDPEDGALGYAWDVDDDGDFDDGGGVSVDTSFVDDGDHVVRVRVTDSDGASDVDAATVEVTNAAPTIGIEVDGSASEGDLVSAAGSFTDPGVADTHTVSIDWGDGTVEEASVTQDAGSGSFVAGHDYADDGNYSVTITVVDDDGGSDATTADVEVANVAPSVSTTLEEGLEDESASLSATFTDPATDDTHEATVDWGDDTSESVAVAQDAGSGSLSASHGYATGGTFEVTLTVTDDDGGATTVTDSIVVTHVVEVDVKPGNGDEADPINPEAKGVVPVAVYTTDDFDAATVAVSSLRFGAPETLDRGDGATAAHGGHLEDVDGDGDRDLVVHFAGEAGLASGDTDVEVVGETADGVPLAGGDAVRIVGGHGKGSGSDEDEGRGNGNRGGEGNGRGSGR